MRMAIRSLIALACSVALLCAKAAEPAITFNKNFEGGTLGKIEKLADGQFRCYVEGQHDERGRNRQADWYYFRMDGVQGRVLEVVQFAGPADAA